MLDQSVFTETIHEVAEIIRTSATPLSKEEERICKLRNTGKTA